MAARAGYETAILMEFLATEGERREDGALTYLNGRRVNESHREMLLRWQRHELVTLSKVDEFLMKYDLMIFELEAWAEDTYGRTGFVDPMAEPLELVS